MSDKRYIACIYEEIHCYKIENKLKKYNDFKKVLLVWEKWEKKVGVLVFFVGSTKK